MGASLKSFQSMPSYCTLSSCLRPHTRTSTAFAALSKRGVERDEERTRGEALLARLALALRKLEVKVRYAVA